MNIITIFLYCCKCYISPQSLSCYTDCIRPQRW